jgi:hypothetical protein
LIQIGWDDGAWFDLDFGGAGGIWWLLRTLPGSIDEEGTLDGSVNFIAPHHFQPAFSASESIDADDKGVISCAGRSCSKMGSLGKKIVVGEDHIDGFLEP